MRMKYLKRYEVLKSEEMDLLLPNNLSLEKAMILEKVISNNIENPPINLHDGGVFKKGVNSKLDSLRDIKNDKTKRNPRHAGRIWPNYRNH